MGIDLCLVKAMHIGLLSKRHLHHVAARLNIIPFLRYQTPFVPKETYKPLMPSTFAVLGVVGSLHEVHGLEASKDFVHQHITAHMPTTAADLEKTVRQNAM